MELKFIVVCILHIITIRFNRTFMELKLGTPLNSIACNTCFNRTFMELKLEKKGINGCAFVMF